MDMQRESDELSRVRAKHLQRAESADIIRDCNMRKDEQERKSMIKKKFIDNDNESKSEESANRDHLYKENTPMYRQARIRS